MSATFKNSNRKQYEHYYNKYLYETIEIESVKS